MPLLLISAGHGSLNISEDPDICSEVSKDLNMKFHVQVESMTCCNISKDVTVASGWAGCCFLHYLQQKVCKSQSESSAESNLAVQLIQA